MTRAAAWWLLPVAALILWAAVRAAMRARDARAVRVRREGRPLDDAELAAFAEACRAYHMPARNPEETP